MCKQSLVLVALLSTACGDNRTFGLELAPYEGSPATPLSCLPNLDGQITAAESSPVVGQSVSFRVSPAAGPTTAVRTVNTAGVIDENGRRVWDWSADDATDQVATFAGEPLRDQWYVSHFPGGEFVLPIDAGGRIDGIYSFDESSLKLHGSASHVEHPTEGQTLMPYVTPVELFKFPLVVGKAWSQTGEVRSATLEGLTPWSQDDVYDIAVDESGELRLPDFTFEQVLRLTTKLTIKPKTGVTTAYSTRQVLFLFECFATDVARATSTMFTLPADDPGADFTQAQEERRLGWF